jgi:ATP-binding cassette, subfamily C, bacterial CydD
VLCAVLAAVERAGVFVFVLGWSAGWSKFVVAGVAAVALAYRALRVRLRTTATAGAFAFVVDSATRDDVLVERGVPSMAIVEATHHTTRAVTDVAIPFVGDVVATVLGVVLIVALTANPLTPVITFVAVAVGLVLMKLLSRPSDVAYERYLGMIDSVFDGFEGRTELLASGASDAFARQTKERIASWRAGALTADLRAAIATRLPVVLALAIAAGVVATRGLDASLVAHGVVFVLTATAFVGVARAAHEMSKMWTRVAPLAPLVRAEERGALGRTIAASGAIALERVTVAYGSRAVIEDVSVEVSRGESLAIVGANGAGKTTLLLAVLGMRELTSGDIEIGGEDLRAVDVGAWRRSVSFLPQRPYLLPRRDVRAAMQFPASDLDDMAMRKNLERVGLWDRLATFPGDPLAVLTDVLSAGERQRLAIARALCKDADVFILDEPDANLDAQGISCVADLVRELAAAGKIVLVAAHTREVIAAAKRTLRLGVARPADGLQADSC